MTILPIMAEIQKTLTDLKVKRVTVATPTVMRALRGMIQMKVMSLIRTLTISLMARIPSQKPSLL